MKTSEINDGLIGKRVSGIFTGLKVIGTIIGIVEDYDESNPSRHLCSKGVKIELDHPVLWGEYEYYQYESTSRVSDDWGNLSYTHLISE